MQRSRGVAVSVTLREALAVALSTTTEWTEALTKLADDIEDLHEERPVSRCSVKKLLDSLDDADRNALNIALNDPNVGSRRLLEWLHKHGYRIDYYALLRHRKTDSTGCRCPKSVK